MPELWKPPFCLHAAGRGSAKDRSYYHDVTKSSGPQRLLLKHTLSGQGILYFKEKRLELNPGDLFMIERPGPYVYCFEESTIPWSFEFISMEFSQPAGILPEVLKENPVFPINNYYSLSQQLKDLINLRMRDDYQLELNHSALAYQLFLSYVATRTKIAAIIPRGVIKLKELINANYTSDLTIKDYAEQTGYTQEAITRIFQQQFKLSPGQYLLNLRLTKACQLLSENYMSIKEISANCGFRSQNYFSRIFLKKLKVTPSQYRSNPDVFNINLNIMI